MNGLRLFVLDKYENLSKLVFVPMHHFCQTGVYFIFFFYWKADYLDDLSKVKHCCCVIYLDE